MNQLFQWFHQYYQVYPSQCLMYNLLHMIYCLQVNMNEWVAEQLVSNRVLAKYFSINFVPLPTPITNTPIEK